MRTWVSNGWRQVLNNHREWEYRCDDCGALEAKGDEETEHDRGCFRYREPEQAQEGEE